MNNHRYYTTKGLQEGGGSNGASNSRVYVLEANMKDLISRMNMMDTQLSKLYTLINKLESTLGNKMMAAYNLLPLNETGESKGYTTEHTNYVFAYPNMVKGTGSESAGNENYPIYLSPRIKYANRTEDDAICPVVNSDLFIAEYGVKNPNDIYDIDGRITMNTTEDFRDEKIIPIEYHFTPSDIKARNYNINETYEGSGVNDVKFGDNMTVSPYNVNIVNSPDIQYNEYSSPINKDTLINKNIQESNISLIKGVYSKNDEFDTMKKYERTGLIAQTVDSVNPKHNFTAQYPNKAWDEMNKNNFDGSIPIPEEKYETKLTVKNEERIVRNNTLEKTTTTETIITPESVMIEKQDSTKTDYNRTALFNDKFEFQTVNDDIKVDGRIHVERINDKDYVRIDDNLTSNGELRIKDEQNQSFTTINEQIITSINNITNSSSTIDGGNIVSSDDNGTTKTTINNGTITSINNTTNSSSTINGGNIVSSDDDGTTKTTINNGTIKTTNSSQQSTTIEHDNILINNPTNSTKTELNSQIINITDENSTPTQLSLNSSSITFSNKNNSSWEKAGQIHISELDNKKYVCVDDRLRINCSTSGTPPTIDTTIIEGSSIVSTMTEADETTPTTTTIKGGNINATAYMTTTLTTKTEIDYDDTVPEQIPYDTYTQTKYTLEKNDDGDVLKMEITTTTYDGDPPTTSTNVSYSTIIPDPLPSDYDVKTTYEITSDNRLKTTTETTTKKLEPTSNITSEGYIISPNLKKDNEDRLKECEKQIREVYNQLTSIQWQEESQTNDIIENINTDRNWKDVSITDNDDYIVVGSAYLSPSISISNNEQRAIGPGNWTKIIKCDDRFIVIGKETTKALIYYFDSADSTWKWKLSNLYNNSRIIPLNDICRFKNNSCIAIGKDNNAYVIDDSSDDWNHYIIDTTMNPNNNWLSIASLNVLNVDYLMILNKNWKYATSQDGKNWTLYQLNKTDVPIAVASGHSSFVILFSDGYVALFSNMTDFSSYSKIKIDNDSFTSLTYTNNRFIAASTSSIYYSVNGRDWFKTITPNASINGMRYFNPIIYLCCNSNILIKSQFKPSLIKSTLQTFTAPTTWRISESNTNLISFFDSSNGFIKYGDDKYTTNPPIQNISSIALSNDGTKLYASNNTSTTATYDLPTKIWTTDEHPIDIDFIIRYTSTNNESFAYINKNLGMLKNNEENVLYTLLTQVKGEMYSCFGNDKFVVMGKNGWCGCIPFSDFLNVSLCAVGDTTKTWTSICFGNNTFIAIANEYNKCSYSNDGENWQEQDIQSSDDSDFDILNHRWVSICFNGSSFVAITSDGKHIATTTNGQSWSYREIASTINTTINSLTFGNDEYIAVGNNGYILKLNLNDNTLEEKQISSSTWFYIHYNHSTFVISGLDKIAYSSSFSSDWTIKTVSNSSITWTHITSSPHLFILSNSTNNSYMVSSNCEDWTTLIFTEIQNNCSVCYGKDNKFLNIGQIDVYDDNTNAETKFYLSNNIDAIMFPYGFVASDVVWADDRFVVIGNFNHFLSKDSESLEWTENETLYPSSFGLPTKICPQSSTRYMLINNEQSMMFNNNSFESFSNLSTLSKKWKKLIYLNSVFIVISDETIAYTRNFTEWSETNIITNDGNIDDVMHIDTITTDGSNLYIANSSNIYILNDVSTIDEILIKERITPAQAIITLTKDNCVDVGITTSNNVCCLNKKGTIKVNLSKQWYYMKPLYTDSEFDKFITNNNHNMIFGRLIEPISNVKIPFIIYSTNIKDEWEFGILPSQTLTITAWNVVWFDQQLITYATGLNENESTNVKDGILYYTSDGENWLSYDNPVPIPTGKQIHNIIADDFNIGVFFNDSLDSYYIPINNVSSHWNKIEDDKALTFKTIVYGTNLIGILETDESTQLIYTKTAFNRKWETIRLSLSDKWVDISYYENKYVLISNTKNSMFSSDGLIWGNALISGTNRNWISLKKKSDSVVAINNDFSFFAYGSFSDRSLDALKRIVLETIYPIGSIYTTFDNFINTPRDVLGFGIWERIENRMLFAIGSNGFSYMANNAEIIREGTNAVGGEASHVLSVGELPSHSHVCGGGGVHKHTLDMNDLGSDYHGTALEGEKNTGYIKRDAECHGAGWHTHAIYNTGSNWAHENMPPYITVKMWQRTA